MWYITKKDGASHLQPLGTTKESTDKKLVKSYLLGNKAVPGIKDDMYRKNAYL